MYFIFVSMRHKLTLHLDVTQTEYKVMMSKYTRSVGQCRHSFQKVMNVKAIIQDSTDYDKQKY